VVGGICDNSEPEAAVQPLNLSAGGGEGRGKGATLPWAFCRRIGGKKGWADAHLQSKHRKNICLLFFLSSFCVACFPSLLVERDGEGGIDSLGFFSKCFWKKGSAAPPPPHSNVERLVVLLVLVLLLGLLLRPLVVFFSLSTFLRCSWGLGLLWQCWWK